MSSDRPWAIDRPETKTADSIPMAKDINQSYD